MKKFEFAVDQNPTTKGFGVIVIESQQGGISPVGPQTYASESAALTALKRAIGDAMKPPET